jgi:hypothetical protein
MEEQTTQANSTVEASANAGTAPVQSQQPAQQTDAAKSNAPQSDIAKKSMSDLLREARAEDDAKSKAADAEKKPTEQSATPQTPTGAGKQNEAANTQTAGVTAPATPKSEPDYKAEYQKAQARQAQLDAEYQRFQQQQKEQTVQQTLEQIRQFADEQNDLLNDLRGKRKALEQAKARAEYEQDYEAKAVAERELADINRQGRAALGAVELATYQIQQAERQAEAEADRQFSQQHVRTLESTLGFFDLTPGDLSKAINKKVNPHNGYDVVAAALKAQRDKLTTAHEKELSKLRSEIEAEREKLQSARERFDNSHVARTPKPVRSGQPASKPDYKNMSMSEILALKD